MIRAGCALGGLAVFGVALTVLVERMTADWATALFIGGICGLAAGLLGYLVGSDIEWWLGDPESYDVDLTTPPGELDLTPPVFVSRSGR